MIISRLTIFPLADFVYMDSAASADDIIDKYLPELEHAAGLGLPFVCAGNDTSSYKDGKISLAPGALAEQYAVLGRKDNHRRASGIPLLWLIAWKPCRRELPRRNF